MNVITGLVTCFRKTGILCQKPIARMNRIGAGGFRCTDDFFNHQITLARGSRSDRVCCIGHPGMQRASIRLGIHRNCANSHVTACADDANGNFASIGDQNLFKHLS